MAGRPVGPIVVATRNPHKLDELGEILAGDSTWCRSRTGSTSPPEDAPDFAGNALDQGARRRRQTGMPALADDSGIEATALGGRPGVRSARYVGPGRDRRGEPDAAARGGRRPRRPVGRLRLRDRVRRRRRRRRSCARRGARARSPREPRGDGGLRLRPGLRPGRDRAATGRWRSCGPSEKHAISHRGRAARAMAEALGRPPVRPRGGKSGAALLSVVSNSVLIVLKLAAGLITGSIAILTEAIHSAIDLIASLIALVSVRKADEPADADHPYGHEKAENVAAGAEAMLILLGAAIIVIEAVRRLFYGLRGGPGRGRHRRDLRLDRGQPGGLHVPDEARSRVRVAGPRGGRGAPSRRRADVDRGAGRAGPGRG